MIGRVTQQTVQRSTLANLQLNLSKVSDLQSRMSGGKKITKASDDPAGTAQALALRAQTRATQQYRRNADDGIGWLSTADTALQSSVTQLRRARDLTVQSGSGAMSAAGREAIATEIDGIRDGLLSLANTTTSGDRSSPARPTPGWRSPTRRRRRRTPGPAPPARACSDGSARTPPCGPTPTAPPRSATGSTSVFALLDNISSDLRAGVDADTPARPRSTPGCRRCSASSPASAPATTR